MAIRPPFPIPHSHPIFPYARRTPPTPRRRMGRHHRLRTLRLPALPCLLRRPRRARPNPPSPDYQFELPVHVTNRDGTETTHITDCWRAGHFALEAKATDTPDGNDKPLR
ncbi:MAG: hypothetical protein SGI84_06915, partial [Gemmatimonadota bacterium]|nr:hypothetical protein [Gemmatimonadota bacterium]